MQLTWLRAGCASIAECGGFTATVEWYGDAHRLTWGASVRDAGGHVVFDKTCPACASRDAAEAACEAWIDQHDKPVWHDATEWLSWAEWRGVKVIVRPHEGSSVLWVWQVNGAIIPEWGCAATISEAKAAAEKYVREHTGGAA